MKNTDITNRDLAPRYQRFNAQKAYNATAGTGSEPATFGQYARSGA
jgi:hypothetical protein